MYFIVKFYNLTDEGVVDSQSQQWKIPNFHWASLALGGGHQSKNNIGNTWQYRLSIHGMRIPMEWDGCLEVYNIPCFHPGRYLEFGPCKPQLKG